VRGIAHAAPGPHRIECGMSAQGESTWSEAMDRDRGRAALISNLDIAKHLRRSEVRAAQAQAWLMLAGEHGSQGEQYGHRGT
jgi:hypothetical protein